MRTVLLIVLGLLVASFPAFADIYQWVDEKGVVSFTDNPDAVPKKYEKKVKVIPSPTVEQAPESQAVPATTPVEKSQQPTVSAPKTISYGGHDEAWWKSRYAALRDELKVLQDGLPAKRIELEQLRRKLTLYTYTRNRIAYQNKQAEIQKDEDRIATLTKQLAELDMEAALAGVPFNWRQ